MLPLKVQFVMDMQCVRHVRNRQNLKQVDKLLLVVVVQCHRATDAGSLIPMMEKRI
jgi:hypothetical protein